jgi:HK97 gp10 family phage protein
MAELLSVKVEGLAVLEKRLVELDRRTTGNVLRKALREGANVLKAEAKARVPVRTGRLKKSIAVTVSMKAKGAVYAKIGFKRGAAYGVPVELGTFRSKARPFLRPAVETKHVQAVDAFASRLKAEIDAAVKT